MKRVIVLSQNGLRAFMAHERMFSLLVAFVIGVAAGLGALGFRFLIHFFHSFFQQFPGWAAQWVGVNWVGVVLAPAVGGLIIGPIIYRFAREARGHGVPEVMGAIIQRGGFIRPRVVFVKALTSAVCIGSGGSVGREGPIIQIGSTIGSMFGHLLNLPPRIMRTFVACGAAGGIAATFNAPIAGAMFAVEVILGDFGFVQLAPIVTSSVIATVISRGAQGNFASFEVPEYALVNPVELLYYLALGLLCGVFAVAFIRMLDLMETVFDDRIKLHEAIKPALGGVIIGVMGIFVPQIFGVGYETIDTSLHGLIPIYLLLALAFAKLIGTTVTLASGGSGGVFAPSLFMGSMLGGLVGKLANALSPGLSATAGAYSLVGMAAMVGAATHAPITAIVIIFELTNDYKIILPLMISTIIAVLTAAAMNRESIYTHKLKKQGLDLSQGPETNLLKRVQVRDIMRTQFEKAPHDLPFSFLVDLLLQTSRSQVPVVDADGRMVGGIPRDEAQKFLLERNLLSDVVVARDLANPHCPVVLPGDTLDQVVLRFQEYNCREIYVLDDATNRKLIGMVRKGDLTDAYQREMVKKDAGDTFAYNINRAHRMESVAVMDGYGIIEIEAPHDLAGRKLAELDLRNKFGVNVLAIKRDEQNGDDRTKKIWVPDRGDSILDGDVLVLLGTSESINRIREIW